MSALESPPALTPLWQDPWGAAVTGAMTVTSADADFYSSVAAGAQTGKSGQMMVNQAGFYQAHPPMMVQGYHAPHHVHPHHGLMENSQNNNNNISDNNSSSTTSSGSGSTKKNQRQVNFKLDIKAEPEQNELVNNPGMQKVPSISDLSDPDSSLDIPCSQVRLL